MYGSWFLNLYSSELTIHIDNILEAIPCKIDENNNEMLCKPYNGEEILESLFQMGPTKALSLIGFPPRFVTAIGFFVRLIFALQLWTFYEVRLFQMVFVI